ncbi:kunitz/Bovine pancreatic trypsin inhibitor domain-containing protein [Ditylenchus destructor]|nr:kunitz/Bovine pancreatic trypsin inhibitor domain-containing protein [Ditylenchus destructor]
MPSIQAIPPRPLPPAYHTRNTYYPVRTNCQRKCVPNNRYRWNYRPTAIGLPSMPAPQPISNSLPIRQTLITYPSQPYIPNPPPPTVPDSNTVEIATLSPNAVTGEVSETHGYTYAPSPYGLPTPPPYSQASAVPKMRPNPCSEGKPLMDGYNPITCNFVIQPNGGCPENYFCHTGASFETTTCCPYPRTISKSIYHGFSERCSLPRSIGEGPDLIPRWYFDTTVRKCKGFFYKGLKGNANNFVSSINCMESCETADRAAAVKNPCANGPPARGLDGELFSCGPEEGLQSSSCPAGYYCHVGETSQTTACCEVSSGQDPCVLALNVGEGTANLPRYYYDTITKHCTEFIYRGMKGNENNFLTNQECRRTCMKHTNPCPVLFGYQERKECSAGINLCQTPGEWCHIGSSLATTACCPGAISDPCKLPLDLGQGSENITRWHADPSDNSCRRECRPFQYRGTKGNQNNFVSKLQCEAVCKPQCFNPCSSGELLLESNGQPERCNTSSPCPVNYWCHIGATPETTVCCTGVERSCNLPVVEGYGKAVLSRWYYNKQDQNCQKFVYRGVGGNQNNHLTYDDCINSCPAYDNPCNGGHPLMVGGQPKICSPSVDGDPCEHPVSQGQGPYSIQRYYYNSDLRRCLEFVYKGAKGNANNFLSVEDCELVCQARKPCELQMDVGTGSDRLERWYYDGGAQLCRPFIYSGLRGNANNFLTQLNPCLHGEPLFDASGDRKSCKPEDPVSCPSSHYCHAGSSFSSTVCCLRSGMDMCELPLNYGIGTESLPRWYHNSALAKCEPFSYAGSRGNENNFLAKDACQKTCPSHRNYCPHGDPLMDELHSKPIPCGILKGCNEGYVCHMNADHDVSVCCENPTNFCLQARESGPCEGEENRYGYNPLTDTCVPYKYSGCGGTLNNFKTLEKCTEICCREYKKMRDETNQSTLLVAV